jgi:peptide/nickel transport system permease protein
MMSLVSRSALAPKLRLGFGLGIIALWLAVALLGPEILQTDPNAQELADALQPPFWFVGGHLAHPLGTDQLGRDIALRIVYGARNALFLGAVAVGAAAAIGIVLGLIAAEAAGFVDDLIMRLADIQLSIPFILLAITLLVLFGGSTGNVLLVLILSGWVTYARVIRGEMLQLKEADFVVAARAIGARTLRIAWRHYLPNTFGLIIVVATLQLADVILLAAALAFLGVGLGPPVVDWGAMLADGRDYLTSAWWISTLPGAAITLVLLGVNIVGDWLRDLLDPRHHSLS